MTVATPKSAFEQVQALAGELLSHDRWSRDEVLAYQRSWDSSSPASACTCSNADFGVATVIPFSFGRGGRRPP